MEIELEESITGTQRKVAMDVPVVDNKGQIHYETRTLLVKVPVGVRNGQMIRLKQTDQGDQQPDPKFQCTRHWVH